MTLVYEKVTQMTAKKTGPPSNQIAHRSERLKPFSRSWRWVRILNLRLNLNWNLCPPSAAQISSPRRTRSTARGPPSIRAGHWPPKLYTSA